MKFGKYLVAALSVGIIVADVGIASDVPAAPPPPAPPPMATGSGGNVSYAKLTKMLEYARDHGLISIPQNKKVSEIANEMISMTPSTSTPAPTHVAPRTRNIPADPGVNPGDITKSDFFQRRAKLAKQQEEGGTQDPTAPTIPSAGAQHPAQQLSNQPYRPTLKKSVSTPNLMNPQASTETPHDFRGNLKPRTQVTPQ